MPGTANWLLTLLPFLISLGWSERRIPSRYILSGPYLLQEISSYQNSLRYCVVAAPKHWLKVPYHRGSKQGPIPQFFLYHGAGTLKRVFIYMYITFSINLIATNCIILFNLSIRLSFYLICPSILSLSSACLLIFQKCPSILLGRSFLLLLIGVVWSILSSPTPTLRWYYLT